MLQPPSSFSDVQRCTIHTTPLEVVKPWVPTTDSLDLFGIGITLVLNALLHGGEGWLSLSLLFCYLDIATNMMDGWNLQRIIWGRVSGDQVMNLSE